MSTMPSLPPPGATGGTNPSPSSSVRRRLILVTGLLLFSAGCALAGAAIAAQAEATAYQAAQPCAPNAAAAGPDCFAREPATIRKVSIQHSQYDTAVVDLILPGRTPHVTISPVNRVENALGEGEPVIAREYRGHITAVEVGGWVIATKADNPLVQFRPLALAALFVGGLGLFALVSLSSGLLGLSTRPGSRSAMGLSADQSVTLPLVLRPESRNATGHVVGLGTLALAGLALVARLGTWAPLGLAGLAVSLLAYAGLRWLYLHNADIFVDELHVGKRDLFGRTTTFDRTEIQKIVLTMQEATSRYGTRQVRRLFLVGQNGRAWLRLSGAYWSTADVELLSRALRVPVEGSWDRPADIATVSREVPGSFNWWEAHPIASAFILVPVILALIVAVAIVVVSLQGQSS